MSQQPIIIPLNDNNQPDMTPFQLQDLITKHGKQATVLKLSVMLQQGIIAFPWKRYAIKEPISYFFDNLRKYEPTITHNPITSIAGVRFQTGLFPLTYHHASNPSVTNHANQPKYMTFISYNSDYSTIDVITDLFQEPVRMKCNLRDMLPPLQVWTDSKYNFKIIDKAIELVLVPNTIDSTYTQVDRFDSVALREAVYYNAKECTLFKSTLAKSVIEFFQARAVLDFSAGWGDRLIGAIAARVGVYHGFDPNTDLRKGHDEMIRQFANPKQDIRVVYEPFQSDAVLKFLLEIRVTYDLVFTSPPFFDFEVYTTKADQSASMHSKFYDWLVQFLFVSLQRSWNQLGYDGHLVIYITDTKNSPRTCELMNLFIGSRLEGSYYNGVMTSQNKDSKNLHRPTWVWTKLKANTAHLTQASTYQTAFIKTAKSLWEMLPKLKQK